MSARTAAEANDQGDRRRIVPRCRHATTPNQLVPRDDTVKVILALSRRSVAFFKREATKQRVPYQRMIRALVDEYTRRMG